MSNGDIVSKLFELQDTDYRDFQSNLIPTLDKSKIIGVRMPILRKMAIELWRSGGYDSFTSSLPHKYYEEENIHAFMIEQIMDYDKCIYELNRFLPYVDNWATCDSMSPKIFKKFPDKLYDQIKCWIESKDTYTVRFAVKTLMNIYSQKGFNEEQLLLVASIRLDDYYVKMAIAWYFATLLAVQYEVTVTYIENKILGQWIHNKAIQKAIESYRITKERKLYLRSLKR